MKNKLPNVTRIFLMSDNPAIINETKKYPDYRFYHTKEQRYNDDAYTVLATGGRDTDEGDIVIPFHNEFNLDFLFI